MEADPNPHPIQLLVNYWELQPAAMGARLDELIRHGVMHVATFVPWQAVESDISHGLARFLQATHERRMTVSLILTPEVGVHFPGSGLPKDAAKTENLAIHAYGGGIPINLPPSAFALPTFFAQEFSKRYYQFLSRMDGMLADLGRVNSGLLRGVRVVLTGSFWKYYRAPHLSCAGATAAFDGPAGDHSNAASLAYRQSLDQYYGQREFMEPNPVAANRWKSRPMDDVNRRWFYQQAEDVFRNRTFQALRKKSALAPGSEIHEVELFTPEADPATAYSQVLMAISGGHGDFFRLSRLVDDAAARASHACLGQTSGYVHWTGIGAFRSLADPEKQFLILKSLLLMGGRGGGILIDESEWFSLSQTFRSRTETFARLIAHGGLKLLNRALYLTPHLWSQAGASGKIWEELQEKLGAGARMIASLDLLSQERDARIAIVDPYYVLSRQAVAQLADWASRGGVAVLPRSALYTEAAKAELEKATLNTRRIEIDLGVPYRLHSVGEGKLVVYDLLRDPTHPQAAQAKVLSELPSPSGLGGLAMTADQLGAWHTFVTAMLSVAEVQGSCRVSDPRLTVVPLELRDGGVGLFVMNGTRAKVGADLIFPHEVAISDLAQAVTAQSRPNPVGPTTKGAAQATATLFALDVPPCGILPLAVEGDYVQDKIPGVAPAKRDGAHGGLWN